MRRVFAVVIVAALAPVAAQSSVTEPTGSDAAAINKAPRITKAAFKIGRVSGELTADVRFTVCDDSEGIFEGGTKLGPGYLFTEERWRSKGVTWNLTRRSEMLDFSPGCNRLRMGWVINGDIGANTRYRGTLWISIRVRDPEGRWSNTVARKWACPCRV